MNTPSHFSFVYGTLCDLDETWKRGFSALRVFLHLGGKIKLYILIRSSSLADVSLARPHQWALEKAGGGIW